MSAPQSPRSIRELFPADFPAEKVYEFASPSGQEFTLKCRRDSDGKYSWYVYFSKFETPNYSSQKYDSADRADLEWFQSKLRFRTEVYRQQR